MENAVKAHIIAHRRMCGSILIESDSLMELGLTEANKVKDIPTLQANLIPHAIRHGAIHGALGTRQVGESLILVAPHNPVPLLKEVEAREEKFELEYLKEEPKEYHIKFTRIS